MEFERLADFLEKLEGTSSRLEMTRLLAELFSLVKPGEGKIIAYVSSGMLGPKYNNPDMGMAEKQALKAVARAVGVEENEILAEFKESGDLGKTVEKFKNLQVDKDEVMKMKVSDVHKKLLEVAGASGLGSQEKKIELLAQLLRETGAKSAKYVTKICVGKMRSGFSDMTVLDSLSWMKAGDKSLREKIEKIYNVRADLGEVVKLVCENEDISKIEVDPEWGTPILVARAERAKNAGEIWERLGVAAAEHKLDGLRIQAHVRQGEVRLFSRGMENVTTMYPDIVEGLKKQVSDECILDGEMIAVGEGGRYLPFQETVQRKRKYDILEMMKQVPLKYYTFDILMKRGKSYLNEPNEERWSVLEKTIKGDEVVRLMPRKLVGSEMEIEEFFKQAIEEGTEGIVVKKLEGVYRSGSRDFNWIKYKKSYDETGMADTIDAVVMGYDKGQGKRSDFGIGGFLIGVSEKKSGEYKTIAKIGTGLTDDEWKDLKTRCDQIVLDNKPVEYKVEKQMECDVWVKPEMVVEIKADEITRSPMHSSGYALRFPRLVSFRDMKVEDAATTAEVERLFKLQDEDRKRVKDGGDK